MVEEWMLTTVDNKWNPFTHFDEWLSFDRSKGYRTMETLGRWALSDYENPENDQIETNKAIDEICSDPLLGSIYRKVKREDFAASQKESTPQEDTSEG